MVVDPAFEGARLGERPLAHLAPADQDVGDLDARVVDVVLHLHPVAEEPQGARQAVAQNGIAEVADVGRLVRVDVGVLDQDRVARGGRGRRAQLSRQAAGRGAAIEVQVEVPRATGLDARHARQRREGGRKFLGDGPRRAAQPPGELEGHGRCEVLHAGPRGVLDGDALGDLGVALRQKAAEDALDLLLDGFQRAPPGRRSIAEFPLV